MPSEWRIDRGSPASDDTSHKDDDKPSSQIRGAKGPLMDSINYGTVLAMLQPQPAKLPSPEEVAAAAAEEMAAAASTLPLDLTLNPNFPSLFQSVVEAAGAAGPTHDEASDSDVGETPRRSKASQLGSNPPGVSTREAPGGATLNPSSAIADARELVERQRLAEGRITSLEGKLANGSSKEELQAVYAEMKRLSVRLTQKHFSTVYFTVKGYPACNTVQWFQIIVSATA